MKRNSCFLLFTTALILAACGGVKLQHYARKSCETPPGDQTLGLIENKCALCHKGDFATKMDICERKDLIIDAVTAKRMPRLKSLSPEERQTIMDWNL